MSIYPTSKGSIMHSHVLSFSSNCMLIGIFVSDSSHCFLLGWNSCQKQLNSRRLKVPGPGDHSRRLGLKTELAWWDQEAEARFGTKVVYNKASNRWPTSISPDRLVSLVPPPKASITSQNSITSFISGVQRHVPVGDGPHSKHSRVSCSKTTLSLRDLQGPSLSVTSA